jgi:hypothetical protein
MNLDIDQTLRKSFSYALLFHLIKSIPCVYKCRTVAKINDGKIAADIALRAKS